MVRWFREESLPPFNQSCHDLWLRVLELVLSLGKSLRAQSLVDRIQHRILAEGFDQLLPHAVPESLGAHPLLRSVGRDEDNGYFTMIGHQATVKFDTVHPRQTQIQQQAVNITQMIRIQEVSGRSKYFHGNLSVLNKPYGNSRTDVPSSTTETRGTFAIQAHLALLQATSPTPPSAHRVAAGQTYFRPVLGSFRPQGAGGRGGTEVT